VSQSEEEGVVSQLASYVSVMRRSLTVKDCVWLRMIWEMLPMVVVRLEDKF
jgi:hypothetical protein